MEMVLDGSGECERVTARGILSTAVADGVVSVVVPDLSRFMTETKVVRGQVGNDVAFVDDSDLHVLGSIRDTVDKLLITHTRVTKVPVVHTTGVDVSDDIHGGQGGEGSTKRVTRDDDRVSGVFLGKTREASLNLRLDFVPGVVEAFVDLGSRTVGVGVRCHLGKLEVSDPILETGGLSSTEHHDDLFEVGVVTHVTKGVGRGITDESGGREGLDVFVLLAPVAIPLESSRRVRREMNEGQKEKKKKKKKKE